MEQARKRAREVVAQNSWWWMSESHRNVLCIILRDYFLHGQKPELWDLYEDIAATGISDRAIWPLTWVRNSLSEEARRDIVFVFKGEGFDL